MAMYDNDKVQYSFDLSYVSDYLQQAQWAELIELKKVISAIYLQKQSTLRILDIGIGNARVPKHLSAIHEIWDMIELYEGIDNAPACVAMTSETAVTLNITDKLKVSLFDASQLINWKDKYDLVLCTWFTPGNFHPPDFDFENYQQKQHPLILDQNPVFQAVFEAAFRLLTNGGMLVLGAVYLENDNTRLKQEAAYKKMGMQVITDASDSFTATRERFWSQRFTKQKLVNYLSFVSPHKINFIALDTYDFALQVHVKK
ncbi:MAG TPA: class I SAM-dependent methyltransferase [Lacibacter sp.]|nr:class I SAM-dependent methyltransferase [Lacibacter sp.]